MNIYFGIVDHEIKYIGSGTNCRSKHLNSGRSSCKEANKHYFTGKSPIVVSEFPVNEEDDVVRSLENYLIYQLQPEWNTIGKTFISDYTEDSIPWYSDNWVKFLRNYTERCKASNISFCELSLFVGLLYESSDEISKANIKNTICSYIDKEAP